MMEEWESATTPSPSQVRMILYIYNDGRRNCIHELFVLPKLFYNILLSLWLIIVLDPATLQHLSSLKVSFSMDFISPRSSTSCSHPSAPVNVSIEEYRSPEEGTQIQFHCDEGYTPSQWNMSQCIITTWTPDPQLLHCIYTSTLW